MFRDRTKEKLRSAAVNQRPANRDKRFPGFVRIRLRDDFARIYAARRYASDKRLTIYVLENELPFTRIGMSVGRKVGGAVVRNLIRRRIREAFRLHKTELPVGYDLLCVVRAGAPASLAEYTDSLCRLTKTAIARSPK